MQLSIAAMAPPGSNTLVSMPLPAKHVTTWLWCKCNELHYCQLEQRHCVEHDNYNRQFVFPGIAWILTRERQPKEEIVKEARKIFEDNKIPTAFLVDTIQDDCSSQIVNWFLIATDR